MIGGLMASALHAQKLPDVRVDQEVVTEEATFIEANRARLLGNFDDAETKLKGLIDKNGKKAVYYYELARIYQEIGEFPKAMSELSTALEIEPDNEWYWQYQANLAEEMEDQELVIQAYEALVKLFPDRHYYLENIAFHQLQNEDPKAALETLSKLEKLAGINYETTRQKHLIYSELGNIDGAASELKKFINTYPNDKRMLMIAAAYAYKNDDIELATIYYEKILLLDPDDVSAKSALFKLNKGLATSNDKLTAFIEDATIGLDDKLFQLIAILTNFQDGNTDISGDQLEELAKTMIDLHGKNEKTLALQADIYSVQNKLDLAADYYIQSISINDENYIVWNQLLYILADLKDVNRLTEYSQEAMDIFPNQPAPLALFALSKAMAHDMNSANQSIKRARIICGKNSEMIAEIEAIEHRIDQLKGQ
jgi:tetratricopeptide (TPR) repeat protein